MDINALLEYTKKNNASDLHIAPNLSPYVRILGELLPMKTSPLPAEEVNSMILGILTPEQKDRLNKDKELDFGLEVPSIGRFRTNVFYVREGLAVCFRYIQSVIASFEQLQIPEVIRNLCDLNRGIIIVTGPTGSGKSTTLASMINYIANNRNFHIITIEDPIEYIFQSGRSLMSQREVGTNTLGFTNALRSSLREDPDLIMVGELRDAETIRTALTAAETGHLVLATLHTNSAVQTIDRIIDVFTAEEKNLVRTILASSLEAVISQQLVKCTKNDERLAVFEVLVATTSVKNLIRESKVHQIPSIMQVGSKYGMITMQDSVQKLLKDGLIATEDGNHILNLGQGNNPITL